jgi:hypothetical protein
MPCMISISESNFRTGLLIHCLAPYILTQVPEFIHHAVKNLPDVSM